MNHKISNYSKTFENKRRINPRIYDVDYLLLTGLARVVKLFSNKHVLKGNVIIDMGCGAKPYRPLFPEDIKYVGVDVTMSNFADIVINPGEPVPLADSFTDCIISTQVVYLIPDYKQYLLECNRLLKIDGKLLITSHGTWTYHNASGGDYYRFTQDGMRYILKKAGFEIEELFPIIGTLGTGLHIRQLIFNSWLKKIPILGKYIANIYNIFTNFRIIIEDSLCTYGTRSSSPVIFAAIARKKIYINEPVFSKDK